MHKTSSTATRKEALNIPKLGTYRRHPSRTGDGPPDFRLANVHNLHYIFTKHTVKLHFDEEEEEEEEEEERRGKEAGFDPLMEPLHAI